MIIMPGSGGIDHERKHVHYQVSWAPESLRHCLPYIKHAIQRITV